MSLPRNIKGVLLTSAEMVGAAIVLGVAQKAVKYGFGAVLFSIGFSLSILFALFAYEFIYRRCDSFLVPEVVSKTFGLPVKRIISFFLISVYVGIMAVEMSAATSVISSLFSLVKPTALLVSVIFAIFSIFGGFNWISRWNSVFGSLMFALLFVCMFKVLQLRGLRDIGFHFSLPPYRELLMWLFLNPVSFMCSQPLVQTIAWMERENMNVVFVSILSILYVTLVGLIVSFVTLVPGVFDGQAVLFLALKKIWPPLAYVGGFLVLFAVFTTVPPIVAAVSTLINDLMYKPVEEEASSSVKRWGVPVVILSMLLSLKVVYITNALSYSLLPRALISLLLVVVSFRRLSRS
ncbi:MAG: sodium:solute symporter family transporter [Thermosulfidibacteraceae bacterium]